MNEILFIVLSICTFVIGYLLSTNTRQKNKLYKLNYELINRQKFLDKVFYLIELNESVDVKLYFKQALKELAEEEDKDNE
jgi:hypothetical protein